MTDLLTKGSMAEAALPAPGPIPAPAEAWDGHSLLGRPHEKGSHQKHPNDNRRRMIVDDLLDLGRQIFLHSMSSFAGGGS